MAQSPIAQAIKNICDEKNIPYEAVIEAIETAMAAAYRKDFGEPNQNVKISFDPNNGNIEARDVKLVIEDFDIEAEAAKAEAGDEEAKKFNPKTEIMLSDAKELDKKYEVGDQVIKDLNVPGEFGRVAAQTAKQVITQKLREAERNTVYNDFKDKEGEVLVGIVQRREGRNVLVDLNKIVAIMPPEEQIPSERYQPGQRFKFYIVSVSLNPRGPQVIISRAHAEMVKKLFALEIPEISGGAIEIMSVAREAGSRSKVSVRALEEGIDPIGSCVGQRGSRVQTIITELGGEKIDIIEYSDDVHEYISNALSPAKIISIDINEEDKSATITVAKDQLSLAIGKSGQNVRLAARLTGWNINIEESDAGDDSEEVNTSENTEPEDIATEAEAAEDEKNTPEEVDELVEEKKEESEAEEKNS